MKNLQEVVSKKLEQMTTLKYYTFCGYARNCLLLLLRALGIGSGDEVIVPGFCCQSIYQAIYDVGAMPIAADVEDKSINISPHEIAKVITSKTKLIYIIHTFGISAEVDRIVEIAKKNSLYLVEDISHSLNGTYDCKKLGSFGDFAICSLTKTMINYQGGFIATNNYNIYIKIKNLQQACLSMKQKSISASYYVYRSVCSFWECKGSIVALVILKFLSHLKGKKTIKELYSINHNFDFISQFALYVTYKQLSKQGTQKYMDKRNKSFNDFKRDKETSIIFPKILEKQTGLMPNHHCGIIPSNKCDIKMSLGVWSNTEFSEKLVNSKGLYERLKLFFKGV